LGQKKLDEDAADGGANRLSCHPVLKVFKEKTDFTIALAGNPNVGKSCIFNQLTGLGVVTANYPGKTVELNAGVTTHNGLRIGIIDLPGTYGIGAFSDDQWVARHGILDGRPDVVVVVVDATNLHRNLYMVLQFLELGFPVVMALNLIDCATKNGLRIDRERLSELLGVPIVPTVAIRGEGIKELIQTTVDVALGNLKVKRAKIEFSGDVEKSITTLEEAIKKHMPKIPYDLPPRALAIQLLEGDSEFTQLLRESESEDKRGRRQRQRPSELDEHSNQERILELSATLAKSIQKNGEPSSVEISRERYGLAGTIADEVQTKTSKTIPLSEKLKHYSVESRTGIPLMILVLLGVFAFIFYVGNLLSNALNNSWGSFVSPYLGQLVHSIVQNQTLAKIVLWGVNDGVLAWLSVGVPYVLIFYLVLSVLEDTGYLNSVAFLTDNIMHKLGLHGRAIIPILTGAGCNVPAVMGTRVLTTKRERIIASTLVVLVPCSARTAVIFGAVGNFLGLSYAVLIFVLELILIGLVGLGLHRLLPGESPGLVMEMFPFRTPSISSSAKKTWFRFRDFALVAFPFIVFGSLAMGALFETGYLQAIVGPIQPATSLVLGLPAVAGVTLILGIVRKELALELLVALAVAQYGATAKNLLVFMTPLQIFVFALVLTIYVPCIATVAVLGRELGWKNAVLIMVFTVALALMIGALAYRLLPFLLPIR
jgi:ferrous iron transport protein B